MLLWVQYHDNASGGAVAVGCRWGMLLWVQYHVNTFGGAIAVVAVWVCCQGCSTMLVVAL